MPESDLPLSDEEMERVLAGGDDPTVEDIEKAARAVDRRASPGATIPEPPSLPYEEPDDETPPDEATPPFIIRLHHYGPQAHSILLPDGRPVGRWLADEHLDLDGPQVYELLSSMGMPEEHARWYEKQRGRRIDADSELAQMPAVQRFAEAEALFEERKEAYREAFVKAQKKK